MKIRFLKFLATVCVLACSFSFVFCLTSCSNGNDVGSNLSFELVNGKEYQVTGLGEDVSTDIVIPDTYKGLPVTSIADGAFKCKYLTSVVIGSNVKTIGDEAFLGCYRMTSVTIPDSVTSIGKGAFVDCFALPYNEYENCKYLYTKSNPYHALIGIAGEECLSYTMHEDTVVVVGGAFDGCSNIENITISGKVKLIGSYTFNNCASLMSIVIPNSVESIGDYAFYNCHNISKAIIGNSVQSIGEYAFSGCSRIERLTIPDSVTSIDCRAFYRCSSLISLHIGNSVQSIGECVFSGCYSLERLTIPDGVTSIGDKAFSSCSSLISVKIGNGVQSIGDSTFLKCSKLESVIIPNSVTHIGYDAFGDCFKLDSVFYEGTAEEWASLPSYSKNGYYLKKATTYYYIENKSDLPNDNGNYWHYDEDGNPSIW